MNENYTIYAEDGMPDERLCAWVTANGLDPNNIRADAPLKVEDGMLEVTEFMFESEPLGVKRPQRRVLMENGEPVVRVLKVPLLSHAEEHGITRDVEAAK